MDRAEPIMGTLLETLRAAAEGRLPHALLFLKDSKVGPNTRCLLLVGGEMGELKSRALALGFPIYGLDTHFLKIIAEDEDRATEEASADDHLLQAYSAQLELEDRVSKQFYDLLGEERQGVPCRSEGCDRGAVVLSVLCRRHHFEAIQRRPCPFD